MKIEKYALLDTDFISKTHFIHGDTEKCLVDLVVEMPGYCFFCHSQIIKELSRHNQQAIGWLQHKISEQKIQCYTDEEILNIFQLFLPSLLQPVFSFSDFMLSRREKIDLIQIFTLA